MLGIRYQGYSQHTDARTDQKLAMLEEFSHFDPGVIAAIEYVSQVAGYLTLSFHLVEIL